VFFGILCVLVFLGLLLFYVVSTSAIDSLCVERDVMQLLTHSLYRTFYGINKYNLSSELATNKNYKNKTGISLLLVLKPTALKQQISNFYPKILSTDASDHIYASHRPVVNVKASFCP